MRTHPTLRRLILATSVSALAAFTSADVHAGAFVWTGSNNFWSTASGWQGGVVPTGLDTTDILTFNGTSSPAFSSTNTIAASPFLLNRLVLNVSGPVSTFSLINGSPLAFVGTTPQLIQNSSGGMAINTPLILDGTLTVGGDGQGLATANAKISGIANIVKNGTSTFRFGTTGSGNFLPPSDNTWVGTIQINAGTVRFNNNAESGRTAVRANPIFMNGVSAVFSCNSEIRVGTVRGDNGDFRTNITTLETLNPDSESILITALSDGVYRGAMTLMPPLGTGGNKGELLVRGTGTQTLAGILNIDEDVIVGRGATLVLAGNASLGNQAQGSIVLNGGTFRLENEATNNDNRLREGGPIPGASTTLQPIGGGSFVLAGNAAGTIETTGRLQIGASGLNAQGQPASNPRSGHLNIELIHRAGAAAETSLTFQNYSRDQQTLAQFATVNFSATDDSVTPQFLSLGQSGNAPRINLTDGAFAVPLENGLLAVTAGAPSIGWATVNSPAALNTVNTVDFATHTADGVAPVTTVPWDSATATDNALLTSGKSISGTTPFAVNSIKIAPAGSGQALNLAGSANLDTSAILLAGTNDYTIRATGSGALAGTATRFIHVDKATLNIEASVVGSAQAIVKSGQGLLTLSNAANVALPAVTAINSGTVRATPGTSLPGGEVRLRGGVLEIQGGTFGRAIGIGAGKINWSGINSVGASDSEDRGSGGFAAFGANAAVTLNSNNLIYWEDLGFVRSGHSLVLNSPTANAMVDFTNAINLTPFDNSVPNYNARDIRVLENPNSLADFARISGIIYGSSQNDLLKSGAGTLELTSTSAYAGNTQVMEGRLLVTGSIASSPTAVVGTSGTIAGNGTVGTILLDGGTVEPGSDGLGTLNAAGLYWRTGTVAMNLGTGNQSDLIALVAGKFQKDPHGAAPYLFDFGGGGEGGRTYTLANFGSTNFVAGNFSFTNLLPGLSGTFAISGGNLTFATNLPAPSFASHPAPQRINVGGVATFSVTTVIPGAYSYQWYKGTTLLVGETASTLTIDPVTELSAGDYTVVVTNGTTPVTSNPATLTANVPPAATPQSVPVVEETGKAIVLAGTDPNPGDTLTFSVVTLPAHGTLSGSAPNITYTPAQDFFGTDTFTFKSRDGLLDSPPATITLNVSNVNDTPVAVADTIITGVATDIIANDTDVDGDTLSLRSAANGAYGTVSVSGNTVTYTPGSAFSSTDTFTYEVQDPSGLFSSGTVTVRLGAPVAFGIVAKNVALTGDISGTVSKVGQPGLSEDGRVAFLGSYVTPERKSQKALIFGNPPKPLVRLGVTTAPGGTLTYAKVTAPVVNKGGDVGFKGSLTKAPAGTADGIWVIPSGGSPEEIVRLKMTVPPMSFENIAAPITTATFSKLGEIALPDDGRLIFSAAFKGGPKGMDFGIWRQAIGGGVQTVVHEGKRLSNIGGSDLFVKTIAVFGPSGKNTLGQRRGFNNSGAVVARIGFTNAQSAIVRFNSDGTHTALLRTGFPYSQLAAAQIKSFALPVLADDGSVSVFATLMGNVSKTSDTTVIRVSPTGVISRVAQESTPLPVSSGPGAPVGPFFKSLSDPVSGDSNRVGFIGTLKAKVNGVTAANDVGIWRHSPTGTLAELAREGGDAVEVSGAKYTTFNSLAWTNDGSAGAAFVAAYKGTTKGTGLWVEDSTGALQLAFRTGQSVPFAAGSKTVKSFTVLGPVLGALGHGGSTNFSGGFAILATFTDKTTGVVTAYLP